MLVYCSSDVWTVLSNCSCQLIGGISRGEPIHFPLFPRNLCKISLQNLYSLLNLYSTRWPYWYCPYNTKMYDSVSTLDIAHVIGSLPCLDLEIYIRMCKKKKRKHVGGGVSWSIEHVICTDLTEVLEYSVSIFGMRGDLWSCRRLEWTQYCLACTKSFQL